MVAMPGAGWVMLAAHLAAAAAVGLWLVAGERAAWALIRMVAAVVARPVEDLAALLEAFSSSAKLVERGLLGTGRRGEWFSEPVAQELALGSSSLRRGPPAGALDHLLP